MLPCVLHEHSNITYLEHQTLRSHHCQHLLDEAVPGHRLVFVFIFCSQLVVYDQFPTLKLTLRCTKHSLCAWTKAFLKSALVTFSAAMVGNGKTVRNLHCSRAQRPYEHVQFPRSTKLNMNAAKKPRQHPLLLVR